jgi:hypothetical protein
MSKPIRRRNEYCRSSQTPESSDNALAIRMHIPFENWEKKAGADIVFVPTRDGNDIVGTSVSNRADIDRGASKFDRAYSIRSGHEIVRIANAPAFRQSLRCTGKLQREMSRTLIENRDFK